LRRLDGSDAGAPQRVVVLATVCAAPRARFRRRAHTRATDAEPGAVPVARATVVDPVSLSSEAQAAAWLRELDPELEAHRAAETLNRVLFAQRIAAGAPHLHEVELGQALVIRAGFGAGEQVAEGDWHDARELVLARHRRQRRSAMLRPQGRLAQLLAGRERELLCEELALRVRADLDAGRLALAAIGLERAYAAALIELAGEGREEMGERVRELARLSVAVEEDAIAALGGATELDSAHVEHALGRLQAALRARSHAI
jgi:hypothetical protein